MAVWQELEGQCGDIEVSFTEMAGGLTERLYMHFITVSQIADF